MSGRNRSFLTLVCLAAVIGFMSWHNMNPHPGSAQKPYASVAGYYADTGATASVVPDDNLPVIIAQGRLGVTADGKTEFSHQGMAPALFAQRQINLLLHLDRLPPNPDEAFSKIDDLLKSWTRQGTTIAALFLDYRPPQPDFSAYSTFIRALQKHFLASPHVIVPVAEVSWLDKQEKNGLALLRRDIPYVLIDLPSAEIDAALLQQLKNSEYEFQARLPANIEAADINGGDLRALDTFNGYFMTLDPHRPVVKKTRTIGIFPKL